MFLVPELADYLRQNARPKVQEAVDRYTRMAPYWMAGHNEEVQHENGITPLYQTHALFQAKAQILQTSRDELAKVLGGNKCRPRFRACAVSSVEKIAGLEPAPASFSRVGQAFLHRTPPQTHVRVELLMYFRPAL